MIQITRLGLNKLFLWSEVERFQTYPAALARLMPGKTYTRQQIGTELFGLTYTGSGKPRRENVLSNLFGVLQIGQDKLLLRGINLFRRITPNGSHVISGMTVWEQANDEWIPTEEARSLGEIYRQDSAGIRWQQLLAEQLARYEPRARVLLYLLGHGHMLRFESPGYFAGITQRAQLIGPVGYALFENDGAAFNDLLFNHAEIAIGPWWREEIETAGFELVEGYKLEGAIRRLPSTNHINSALKTALFVFYKLGILVEYSDGWRVDVDSFVRQLAPEIAHDLFGNAQADQPNLSNEWARLAHVINKLADGQGFIVVSEAADLWGELSDLSPGDRLVAFDRLMRRGTFEGRVEVLDRHPGQPRMGRGLFDDDNMRMVKLRVLT